jgi:hypothetical protein
MNLLSETIDVLNNSGKTRSDVRWIGSTHYGYFDWEHFVKIANVEYDDDGYGAAKVASHLVIVGDDWWLERQEYDGSEWWSYKSLPTKPLNKIEPNRVTYGYDRTLREMNEKRE